jgi:hypothetical protein
MVAQDFDVVHLVIMAAAGAFQRGHQFFDRAFFHNQHYLFILFLL